jgi:ribosome-associated translation inhibitor RaiA
VLRIQVNSDNTVAVDANVKRHVKDEVHRILVNFTDRLTRVEVHLSDVNSLRSGPSDKRCLVEARPAGDTPRSASATADTLPAAIALALRKMRRSLTSFFGKKGRASKAAKPKARPTPASEPAPRAVAPAKAPKAPKAAKAARPAKVGKPATAAKAVKGKGRRAGKATTPAEPTGRRPKKKPIFQARRKSWPSRSR